MMNNNSVTVTIRDYIKFRVVRHTKVWRKRHYHQDFLGFYTLESHRVSKGVHGLLGMALSTRGHTLAFFLLSQP